MQWIKKNFNLISGVIIIILIICNIALILSPIMTENFKGTYIGKIDGKFSRLTLEENQKFDFYDGSSGTRSFGVFSYYTIKNEKIHGVLELYGYTWYGGYTYEQEFGLNNVFAVTPGGGNILYNVTAIFWQCVIVLLLTICVYFAFFRDKFKKYRD